MRVPPPGRTGALLAVVLLVGACTGGGPTSSPGGAGGGSAASPGSNGGAPSGAPSAATAGGGGGGGGGSAGSLNACNLLTTDEIAAAVGWPVNAGVLQNTDTQTDCEWDAAGSQGSGVGLIVSDYDDTLWQAGSAAGNSTAVSGIGDAAFKGWPHAGDLAIKFKGYEVDVAIIDFAVSNDKLDAENLTLAKLVLPRL